MSDQNIYDNETFFKGYRKLRKNPSAANDIVEKQPYFHFVLTCQAKRFLI